MFKAVDSLWINGVKVAETRIVLGLEGFRVRVGFRTPFCDSRRTAEARGYASTARERAEGPDMDVGAGVSSKNKGNARDGITKPRLNELRRRRIKNLLGIGREKILEHRLPGRGRGPLDDLDELLLGRCAAN